MTAENKTDRLTFAIEPSETKRIRRAARLSGKRFTAFLRDAALVAADAALDKSQSKRAQRAA
jgi:uncharacterized protein (DUF1778 family)